MTATVEAYPVAHGRCSHCGRTEGTWPAYLVIAAIQAWAAEHGRPPRANDWTKASPSHPTQNHVAYLFGSFALGIRAAGFEPGRPWGGGRNRGELRWTEEKIIEAMLDWVVREGRWPVIRDWQKATETTPSYATVIARFGTWNAARLAAGYSGNLKAHLHERATQGKKTGANVRRERNRLKPADRHNRNLAGV